MNIFTPSDLLRTWCDGLLAHQVAHGVDGGGIFCPSHGFVHGRCGDVVYPLLALFSSTGAEEYRAAAHAVYGWSERHVSQADGSWTNEANGRNDWKGITCFSLISLGETLRMHAAALTDAEQKMWRARLRRGADFLADYLTFETGDVNYQFSSAAALALAGTVLGEPRYLARARALAEFSRRHFTANQLIWGEGARGPADPSPTGLRPIDVPYNIEESLPNLALYAELTHDTAALEAAVISLRAHLAWMLPDGGWDAGWCTRLAKWTYWGSRTSDGCAGGCALLQAHDPRFAESAHRNLRLMAAHTHAGLLHGGPHVHARGLPICSHPTFAHARGLATALDAGLPPSAPALELPGDHAPGVRRWPEAGVTQIALGSWRASISLNDIPATPKRGGHPSGGALSMLWHARTGPLLVASMSEYVRYEPSNMDAAEAAEDRAVLTPRLEAPAGDRIFSNLHDQHAELAFSESADRIEVSITGHLRDAAGQIFAEDLSAFTLHYVFTPDTFEISANTDAPCASLHLPVISRCGEAIAASLGGGFEIVKADARVKILAWSETTIDAPAGRVFNFVPGLQAVPLSFKLQPHVPLTVRITIQPPDYPP